MITIVTLQNKVELFKKIILDKLESDYKEKNKVLDEKNKEVLSHNLELIEKKKKDLIEKYLHNARINKLEILVNEKLKIRKELLFFRKDIINELFEEIKNDIKDFSNSEDYILYLNRNIEKAINETSLINIILVLSKKDFYNSKITNNIIIKDGIKYQLNFDEDINIGGFIMYDIEKKYKYDYSIDKLLEESKYLIGERVFKLFEKVGDINV